MGPVLRYEPDRARVVLDLLLAVPPSDRLELLQRVQETICFHCGEGSRELPNPKCNCQTD